MEALVILYIAVDTLLFIPLYVLGLTGLRGMLRRRNHPRLAALARCRRWRWLACATATADLGENILTAALGLTPALEPPLQPVLLVAGHVKWLGVAGMVLGLLVLVAGRAVTLGKPGLKYYRH